MQEQMEQMQEKMELIKFRLGSYREELSDINDVAEVFISKNGLDIAYEPMVITVGESEKLMTPEEEKRAFGE